MARVRRMTKKRLGEILVDEALITEEQVQEALEGQRETGELLGEVLVRKGYVTETDIARSIATQFSLPFLSVGKYDVPREVLLLLPFEMLEKHQFIPLDRFGNVLTVVVAGLLNSGVLEQIEEASGCTVQAYVGIATEVKEKLRDLALEQIKGGGESRAGTGDDAQGG